MAKPTHPPNAREGDDSEMEMTPMIDVTFLLLIFFMCTLRFKTLEGKLAAYLPKDVGVNPIDALPIEKIEVELHVLDAGEKQEPGGARAHDGEGRFVYDDSRRIEYRVGTLRTTSLRALGDRLDELHRLDPERAMTLDARPGVVVEDVVQVLDRALAAGHSEISFVGARE